MKTATRIWCIALFTIGVCLLGFECPQDGSPALSLWDNQSDPDNPSAEPPVAKFYASPYQGTSPLTAQFTDISTAGSAPITQWRWDFDSDSVIDSTDRNPQQTYWNAGKYNVTLEVQSEDGNDTITLMDVVEVLESEDLISGSFEWSSYVGGTNKQNIDHIKWAPDGTFIALGTDFMTRTPAWSYDDRLAPKIDEIEGHLPNFMFVARILPTGQPLWKKYVGPQTGIDYYDMAVSPDGGIYVCGSTDCIGWVQGGFQTQFGGGYNDGFLMKLDKHGNFVGSFSLSRRSRE